MTNREALKAKIGQPVKQNAIDLALLEQSMSPEGIYDPTREDDRKGMDLALAGLLFSLCTNPKSVKELDYLITQHDVDDMLKLRSILLKRWGVPDELETEGPTIQSVSDLW